MTQDERRHRAPLAPGEVRTHEVDGAVFRVMHTGGGSFTQVTRNGVVLTTSAIEDLAVGTYANAIALAESEAMARRDEAHAERREAFRRGEAERRARAQDELHRLVFNTPMGAEVGLVTGEPATVVDAALQLIQEECEHAAIHTARGDVTVAATILARAMGNLADLLAPPYADAMPKTVIVMRNGSSLQVSTTNTNTAADIAGLMNAGTPKVYSAVDVNDGIVHNILVSEIQDVYEAP